MKTEWDEFKSLLCTHDQKVAMFLAKDLQGPVPFEAIDSMEKELAVTLPGDYKASLRIHGGNQYVPMLGGYIYLPPSYVMAIYRKGLAKASDMKERISPRVDNGIAPIHFSLKRIPIAANDIETVYIDMAPTVQGRVGQVILCTAEGNFRVIAPDFKTFFKNAVREFIDEREYFKPKNDGPIQYIDKVSVYDPSLYKETAQ